MVARVQLAVLDFNSGTRLVQAKDDQGDLRYKHQYSKTTQSWVAKKITERKDKEPFRNHILDEVMYLQLNRAFPPCIAIKEKPDKQET